MMHLVRRVSALGWSALREFFSLNGAEQSVQGLSNFDRIEIRREIERAAELMREADQSRSPFVRAQLARQALARVIVATAAARRLSDGTNNEEWPDLERAIQLLLARPDSNEHQQAIARVSGSDVLTDSEYALLADLFAFLERRIELRSARDILMSRWLRRLGLIVLIVIGYFLAVRPTNLARGRMVISSSQCSEMPATPLGEHRLARVIDGVRVENSYAICTNLELNPWVTVDLGAPHSIQRIVVYPQSEGNWGKTDIPQEIRLSLDNEHFEVAGECSKLYTTDFPWRLNLQKKRAQYIQLIGTMTGPQKFVLNEIEVYGQ